MTITGTGFEDSATLTFGGIPTPVQTLTATQITCDTPPNTPGPCDVEVTNPDGQPGVLSAGFTFHPAPTVTSVVPISGIVGTRVTITGAGFSQNVAVTFDGTTATKIASDENTFTCDSPSHAAGPVDVRATNPDTQSGLLAAGYIYFSQLTATSVIPTNGPTTGGTGVLITGNGFQNGLTVEFGGALPIDVTVVDSSTINCTTPPNSGSATVQITNPDGQSDNSQTFLYNSPPSIFTVVNDSTGANNGPTSGDTDVTITGTNLLSGATVRFGQIPATITSATPPTQIKCKTPANVAGPCDVDVTNSDGQQGTLAAGFVYLAPPPSATSVNPGSGQDGDQVTIIGTGFQSGASVEFDGTPAADVEVFNSAQFSCTVPPNPMGGIVSVTVTNPDGQSDSSPPTFSYT